MIKKLSELDFVVEASDGRHDIQSNDIQHNDTQHYSK
jgi:hypothetical protein